uniref:Uncharacterized protein n=1 Tax=Eutreptiella gymnastica TaxID=73025 RepID=A0A7S1J4I8_9EUGL|mmetsp:Transcript_65609/g.116794  ORF Transcript_65609/g.116794 Transcript_65609/m.116794 type:complete len:112 (+) Transcript_65609:680-1015(+)
MPARFSFKGYSCPQAPAPWYPCTTHSSPPSALLKIQIRIEATHGFSILQLGDAMRNKVKSDDLGMFSLGVWRQKRCMQCKGTPVHTATSHSSNGMQNIDLGEAEMMDFVHW